MNKPSMDYITRPSLAVLTTSVVIWLFYLIGLAVYRLYFSPIARFPGPKIAALTKWYEFYYDVILKGQFTFQTQRLHKKYGPIVRITPFEVHIEDSEYYDTLYSRSNKFDKYEWMSGLFGANNQTFTTAKSDLHAIRRAPLNPFFSKRSIARFEPVIREKVEIMCEGIEKFKEKGEVLVLSNAFSAYAGDVITEYCFGFSYNHLKSPGFSENFHQTYDVISEVCHLFCQFPMMHPIMKSLPEWMTAIMAPDLLILLQLQKDLRTHISRIINGEIDENKSPHPTIFHELLKSNLPPEEKSLDRLGDEAQLMIGAGLETTGRCLGTASFHIINNPSVFSKLRKELEEAIPDPGTIPDATELEKLPYLSACIQEAVRLIYGISSRNPRVSPDKPMRYKEWEIPAGVPVSMTIVDINHDERIFPNSRSFIPERWLGNPKTEDGENLGKYNISFGRDARSCLGVNLAKTELYLALATVFRRFTFELYETDITDIELKHDLFLPFPKLDTKGIRVKVTSVNS